MRTFLAALFVALVPVAALAQFKEPLSDKGPKLDRAVTQRIRVGVIIKATGGTILRAIATIPVPADWPEQQVRIVGEDVSPSVKSLDYRTLSAGGSVRQMVVEVPQLPSGQEARALVTFEVTRRALVAPDDPTLYRIPKKIDRLMNNNVGVSPYIESRHPKIVSAARQAVAEAETDWQKAQAIYQWVRDNVAYKQGELKGAARALADKEGDVDELVSLFVAMCRAQKIPARTVFVLGGCSAEFYLEDDEGQGHWFPCQPALEPSFGSISAANPILQKGDNFKNPQQPNQRLRYVTEYFTAAGRGGQPNVKFICEPVAN